MSHLLTGSEDGYIRDYDIFSAVNGKVLLTAPQRHHAGVVEGILKAGQIRTWWEHPFGSQQQQQQQQQSGEDLSPVYSMALQGDALWGLAGTVVSYGAGYVRLRCSWLIRS
jgi:transcriptional activator SPT8